MAPQPRGAVREMQKRKTTSRPSYDAVLTNRFISNQFIIPDANVHPFNTSI